MFDFYAGYTLAMCNVWFDRTIKDWGYWEILFIWFTWEELWHNVG